MTATQKADARRRELLLEERFARFHERMLEAQQRGEELSRRLCEARLRKARQVELEFVI
jgi:hypothetical protein